MRKIKIALIFAVCLLFVTSAVTAQKAKNIITNADVVEMVKASLPESTIILAIQQSEPNFDTSPKALIELSKQGVPQKIMDAMLQKPQATKPVPQNKPEIANVIATKDIGSLRVVLKSVLPVNLNQVNKGMRCSFEFINLETEKPISVGMNAIAPNRGSEQIGSYLRSTLVGEKGDVWRLSNSDVTGGIGKVGVGRQQQSGDYYDPAEITTLLSKRDNLNADFVDINSYTRRYFIFGDTTEISPGQSIAVTAIFVQDNNQTNEIPSKVFQMASEIVVGIRKSDMKKSYTLYNLTFDNVSISPKTVAATTTTKNAASSEKLNTATPITTKHWFTSCCSQVCVAS